MALSFDTSLEPEKFDLEADVAGYFPAAERLREMGALTLWEIQSQLATLVLISLVALVPIFVALAVMIVWAMVATTVYFVGRQRGFPDVLETHWSPPRASSRALRNWFGSASISLAKTYLAGIQPYLYTRIFCPVLGRPVKSTYARVTRFCILLAGLTLFGVTAAHHLLRKAGFRDREVLTYSLVGPLLNVPYRVFLSALVINSAFSAAKLL